MENINCQLSMCFNIEQDGSISGLANYQSLNPALDKEAMRIARKFRYEEPAIYHDERVVYPWGMTLYFPIKY